MTTRRKSLHLDTEKDAFEALARLCPDDRNAIADGRLFANGKRIRSERERLAADTEVTWYAPKGPAGAATADARPLLLEQREGIVALNKPAAWSSEPDTTGDSACLRSHLLEQLKLRELHIATRLDVGVSGLVLASTHAQSRRHLAKLMEEGTLHRSYLAIALGALPPSGRFEGSVEEQKRATPRAAITDFECLAQATLPEGAKLGSLDGPTVVSLVYFRPKTGRRHQLRIHASRHGHPLIGDRRYGGPRRLVGSDGRVFECGRILLHAIDTELTLPSGAHWSIHCPVDEEVGRLWELLGGKNGDVPQ
jgi:23S rRNA-/tRNA-specific pseudouridylate synthase